MRIGIRAHDVAYAPLEELIPNIHAQGFTVCILHSVSLLRSLSRAWRL